MTLKCACHWIDLGRYIIIVEEEGAIRGFLREQDVLDTRYSERERFMKELELLVQYQKISSSKHLFISDKSIFKDVFALARKAVEMYNATEGRLAYAPDLTEYDKLFIAAL